MRKGSLHPCGPKTAIEKNELLARFIIAPQVHPLITRCKMKYYILNEDYNNCKNCFLENRNSLDFMMEYYEGKLFESTEVIFVQESGLLEA